MKKSYKKLNDGGDPGKGGKTLNYKTRKGKSSKFSTDSISINAEGNLQVKDVNSSSDINIRKTRDEFKEYNPQDVRNDVVDYYGKLYNSKFYSDNQKPETIASRKEIFKKYKNIPLNLTKDPSRPSQLDIDFNDKTNELFPIGITYNTQEVVDHNSDTTKKSKGVLTPDGTIAHEFGHAFYTPHTKKLAESKISKKDTVDYHDRSPEEMESDINAIRYNLYRHNIWDLDKSIDESHLDRLDKLNIKDFAYRRAKRLTNSKKDLLQLLNKVAYQENDTKKNIQYVNNGGKIQAQDLMGLTSAIGSPMAAIPAALGIIGKLAYNPASYTPAKMNESPMGYAYGGDMKQQLNMLPDVDKALGEHAVEVQGKDGIDTNYRNIDGQDVALTKGEIVREDSDGLAYVWSNNPKMKHSSGETFAKAMKPVENKIAKIKRRIENDPTDHIATNTLGHLEQIVEQNKNEEEMLRQAKGSPNAQAYNKGGYIKANDGIASLQNKKPIYVSQELDPVDLYGGPMIPNEAMDALISGRLGMRGENVNRKALDTFAKAPKLADAGNMIPQPQKETFSTFEDKAFLGAKGLETVGRVANALQKPRQYDPRRYNIDKIKYNPNRVLDRNEANYQSAQFDINTGNANTDRILRNNVYGQKLQADRDVYREYDQMQRQSDLQIDQYNAQAMSKVDDVNEQVLGRQQQARDAALTSIGNMASIFQQAGGAKAHNKITLATLNSLSKRYGIDVPNLMLMMEGQGDSNKGVVNYKGK